MLNLFRKETQLEIFNTKAEAAKPQGSRFFFVFENLVKYDKIIFSGIAFIIIFLLAYSLGFERGKHLNIVSLKKDNEAFTNITAEKKLTSEESKNDNRDKKTEKITYVTVVKNTLEQKAKTEKDQKKKYLIQVASYLKNSLAKKEALNLKNKGFNPLIMNKGKFFVVYVAGFDNKNKAEISLKKLKMNYRDCFIKRI